MLIPYDYFWKATLKKLGIIRQVICSKEFNCI